jgi:hypothetical protein
MFTSKPWEEPPTLSLYLFLSLSLSLSLQGNNIISALSEKVIDTSD